MVIWLIGISGAGKTTLGKKLKEYLDTRGRESYLIDGNLVRDFFDNDLGFSREDRVANIKRIMLAAHILSQNGKITIVCNIHPFEELRRFARRKIEDYNEIYLKKSLEDSRRDDDKGVYWSQIGKTEIVGLDIGFDEPECSDLVVHTGKESVEESFAKIVRYLKNKYPEEF